MKKMIQAAAAAAAVMLMTAAAQPASADEIMNFRMTAKQTVFTADALAAGDQVVKGNLFIDHYSGLSQFRIMLRSDAPLVIENGDYTRIADQIGPDQKPQLAFFKDYSSSVYTQYNADTGISNLALWYAKESEDPGIFKTGTVNDANSSLLSFDVRIPKGTAVGDYTCYVAGGVKDNGEGQPKTPEFSAYLNRVALEPGKDVLLTPVTFSVYSRGDVNCDGVVDLDDAQLALLFYTKVTMGQTASPDEWYAEKTGTARGRASRYAADLTGTGSVDLSDAQSILRYYTLSMGEKTPDWNSILS